jgi:DNA/RNA endonuclease G (NUC1)
VELWEDALLAVHPRVSSFSGPALQPDDPVHGEVEQTVGRLRMRQSFRLPRAFWKLVVVPTGGAGLATAAFWLDQTALEAALARRRGVPAADLAGWRIDVATLEARTGLDFGATLRAAAPLAAP